MAKTCQTLKDAGCNLHLVGRNMPNSVPYTGPFSAERLTVGAQGGVRFYAQLQLALWRWIKDLEGLTPFGATTWTPWPLRWRGKLPVMYDSHEYFTEAAGHAPCLGWSAPPGALVFLKLPCMITVNDSIAEAYRTAYGMTCAWCATCPDVSPGPWWRGGKRFWNTGSP